MKNFSETISELKKLSKNHSSNSIQEGEEIAGRLLWQAIQAGALSKLSDIVLRNDVDRAIEKNLFGAAFVDAIIHLERQNPKLAETYKSDRSDRFIRCGTLLLAEILENEPINHDLPLPVAGRMAAPKPVNQSGRVGIGSAEKAIRQVILQNSCKENQPTTLKSNDIPVSDSEVTVLYQLRDAGSKTLSQIEINVGTGIPLSTIKNILPSLEKRGLVNRPLGIRKGYAITQNGLNSVNNS